MNEHVCDENGGDLNNTFSQSLVNYVKGLEECCTEADNLGHLTGQNQLENHLKSFLAHCNGINAL